MEDGEFEDEKMKELETQKRWDKRKTKNQNAGRNGVTTYYW